MWAQTPSRPGPPQGLGPHSGRAQVNPTPGPPRGMSEALATRRL